MATKTRLTLPEFLALPGIDEGRLELIDGEVCEKMSPRWGHSQLALRLGAKLDEHGFAGVEPRAIIPASATMGASAPLPDIAFYRDNPPGEDEWMTRPPDLAVEILSPGQRRAEMRAKIDAYLAFGIPCVWVIDVDARSIDIYETGTRRTAAGEDVVETPSVPGFRMTAAGIFALLEGRGGVGS